MKILVCLSTGRHPVSGRPRMAPSDRAALELALSAGEDVTAIHSGAASSPVLTDYLGMGLRKLVALDAEGRDAVAAIAHTVAHLRPDLILTGTRSETGDGTGLFPYLLARELGWPMLSHICSVEGTSTLSVLQVAPGGRRRRLTGPLPAVLAVADGVLHPRMPTLAARRAGRIITLPTNAPLLPIPETRPARQRAARLRPGKGAATAHTALHANLSPDEAARLILDTLRAEGLVPNAPPTINESQR